MLTIKKSQFETSEEPIEEPFQRPQDVTIRRLLGQLEHKKEAIDNCLMKLQTVKTLQEVPQEVGFDLEYILGKDWQNFATGRIL